MKETQTQIIARLEKELKETKSELEEYKEICNKLNMGILKFQLKAEESLFDISELQQIKKRIDFLESRNKRSLDKNVDNEYNKNFL